MPTFLEPHDGLSDHKKPHEQSLWQRQLSIACVDINLYLIHLYLYRMTFTSLAMQSLKTLPLLATIISVLIAVITISFRTSSTDDSTKRKALGSVIIVSAAVQIILAVVGLLRSSGAATGSGRSLWGSVLMNSAAAFAIVYAVFLMNSSDGVALGAAALTVTVMDALAKAGLSAM